MNFGKLKIIFTIFLMIIVQKSFCQCGGGVIQARRKAIPNEPYFWFSKNSEISYLQNGQILIRVDTSYSDSDINRPIILSNSNFGKFSLDSSGIQTAFIENLSTQETYSTGCGSEKYSIDLKNCYIRFFKTLDDKLKISVFDYIQSKVTFYDLSARNIGYNDTCIFIAPNDFKFKRKKYRSGTVVSLNENGIKIIKPVRRKWEYFDHNCLFYSSEIKAYRELIYENKGECMTEYYFKIKINYKANHVDSFEIITNSYFSKPMITFESDTIICHSYKNTYRKYYKTTFVGEWKYSDWVESYPILKNNWPRYYNKGDLLLLKLECGSSNIKGLETKDKVLYTLNGVKLKDKSTTYTLVMAF